MLSGRGRRGGGEWEGELRLFLECIGGGCGCGDVVGGVFGLVERYVAGIAGACSIDGSRTLMTGGFGFLGADPNNLTSLSCQ